MNCRPRAVWSRAWRTLSNFFTTVGCHSNQSIAMYAIDSLKQLSMKFLDKGEMKGFQFQSAFLRPFELVMQRSSNANVRELVLCVMENVVLARVAAGRARSRGARDSGDAHARQTGAGVRPVTAVPDAITI